MIWKLLKKNISAWQIGGYALATFVGLAIVLVALQLFRDVAAVWLAPVDESDGQSSRNVVISKPVSLGATISGKSPSFTAEEIEQLEKQPFVRHVYAFQAADFSVMAGIEIGGRGMSTALFFESVPDELLDVDTDEWHFDPENPVIPIMLPKDYLTLYNLGFAASGRMPMVSEGVLMTIPLRIGLSGSGHADILPGRIVAFSPWLNTIAVPEAFMTWAHERYGNGDTPEPTRLIVETDERDKPAALAYMEQEGYEVAGPAGDDGSTAAMLRAITAVVVGIGGVITLLAIFILVLSLYLLVQKNRRAISGLLLLGYTPGAVSTSYIRLVLGVNCLITVFASVAMVIARHFWGPLLSSEGVEMPTVVPVILAGVGIMAVVSAMNVGVIRRLVRKCFRQV